MRDRYERLGRKESEVLSAEKGLSALKKEHRVPVSAAEGRHLRLYVIIWLLCRAQIITPLHFKGALLALSAAGDLSERDQNPILTVSRRQRDGTCWDSGRGKAALYTTALRLQEGMFLSWSSSLLQDCKA